MGNIYSLRDLASAHEEAIRVHGFLSVYTDKISYADTGKLKLCLDFLLAGFRKLFAWIDNALPERHITAHILRHTYITRLFEAGLDLKEIQYLAGHSTVEMTLRVYAHYDRLSRESQTAEKVRAALSCALIREYHE